MSRLAVLLAAVCALSACNKSSDRSPEPAQAPQAADDSAVEETPEPVVEVEEEQVDVTPALVASYAEFRKKVVEASYAELAALNERAKKVDENSTVDALGVLNDAAKRMEKLDAKTEALRKAAGLSVRQVEVLDDLVTQLVTTAMLVEQLPDMSPIVESMKEQAKSAPEEQRGAILAEIENMEKGAREMREHKEARATFGDKSVDAVLEHLPELMKHRKEMIELYSKLR